MKIKKPEKISIWINEREKLKKKIKKKKYIKTRNILLVKIKIKNV